MPFVERLWTNVGYGKGMNTPEVTTTLILPIGTIYEISNPNAWHAVCPINDSSYSLMITGLPWVRPSHKSTKILSPLNEKQENESLNFFKKQYLTN